MEDNEVLLYKIRIKGRVQGVGFRWNAASVARTLGIKGFVRNMPDGSVYIEAEGEKLSLVEYISWCRSGPVYSSVESVEYEKHPPGGFVEFRVEH